MHPGMFFSTKLEKFGSNDVLDAALLCAVFQWKDGVEQLMESVKIAFTKAKLTDKFIFVSKMFAILKYHRHAQTQKSI